MYKAPTASGSQSNLHQYSRDDQSVGKQTLNLNNKDSSMMLGYDNGASSMQQISYYDHMSQGEDTILHE